MSINIYDKLRSAFGGAIVDGDEVGVVNTDFNNNLDNTVTNVQQLADAIDNLSVGGGGSMSSPELSELIVNIPQRVDVGTNLNGVRTFSYRVYNRERITSLNLFVNQGGIFSTFPVNIPTSDGLHTAAVTLTNVITTSDRKIGFVLVANGEFLSDTNIIQVDTIEGSEVTVDSSSLADLDAANVQEVTNELNQLIGVVNGITAGGGTRLGAITPFTGSVTVNAGNYENYDQEVALYVRSDNARVNFILPSDAVIQSEGSYPVTITILHQGGTERITSGGLALGPDNTIRVDVAGANNIRRNTETGTLLNFAQVFRNDFATFTKSSSTAPWVFRSSTLSDGALLLPDGIFNLDPSVTIRFTDALQFFVFSTTSVNPTAGDAYRVTVGDDDFAGFGVEADDVLVALVDNPSQLNSADNDDWLIIRNAHNNTISLTELNFLNQITEVDTNVDSRLIDRSDVNEVNVWLSPYILDHAPFLSPSLDPDNPQSGETEDYLGGREDRGANNEFEHTSALPSRLVYVDIDGSFPVNELANVYLVHKDRDGNEIARHNLQSEFRGVTLTGSSDTYYVFDDVAAADNFSSINYINGQTLEVIDQGTIRNFNISQNVNVVGSIQDGGIPIEKLSPNVQAQLNSNHALTHEQEIKLEGLTLETNSESIPNTFSFYAKLNSFSNNLSDYHSIEQQNGLLPNYESTITYYLLIDTSITTTQLQKVESTSTKQALTSRGVLSAVDTNGNEQIFNSYVVTLPAITGANSVLDNAWQIDGTINTSALNGAVDSFKVHTGNLGQDVLDRLNGGGTTPVTLPDNLQRLSDDMTVTTRTETGWRALSSPIRSTLTRQFAALWDENRRTFTGNYFDDITPGIDVLGFNSNNVFYYADPNAAFNTSFPGAQSYILNDNIRFRNTSPNTTPITDSFRKVIGFDYALQRALETNDNADMLRVGASGTTALIGLSEEEGLYLNIGRGDGGQRSRTYDVPLQVENSQWHEVNFQPTTGEAEVIIPNDLSGSLTLRIDIELDDDGNDEGTHSETITITNLGADQTIGNRSFTFSGFPTVTVAIRYEHNNTDLSTARRVLFLDPTNPFNNAALTYNVAVSYQRTETWNVPTTYARYPINAGDGHDDFGLFDPHRYNTEHVNERNRVLLMVDTYREGDTDSDPELAVRVVVDGEREGSSSNNYTIRLHRPASDFAFNDISFGNSISAISHVQVYDYDEDFPPSEAELLTLYAAGNRWLGAFTNDDFRTDAFRFTADIELAQGEFFILSSPNGTRHRIQVADNGTLSATVIT